MRSTNATGAFGDWGIRSGPLGRSLANPKPRCHPADAIFTVVEPVEDDGDSDVPVLKEPATDEARAEGVLLIAKAPMSLRRLATLARLPDATRARTVVRGLNETYRRDGRGLSIETVAGGLRLMSHSSVAPWLGRLGYLPVATRLSTPMMETLAVVAYREPVTRAEVESIRGLACGEILRQLMSTELIRIAGRSEELGRPYQYATTSKFLKIFGLPSLAGLPPIDARDVGGDSSDLANVPNDSSPPPAPSGSPELPMPTLLDSAPASLLSATGADPAVVNPEDESALPLAVIEDEEDDLYEKGPEVDDEEEDDWDDDEEEADDEEEEDEGWQEVSDDDSDEDWGDDDEEEDDDDDDEEEWDDAAEDDEDWED